jgi:hypothetical protein
MYSYEILMKGRPAGKKRKKKERKKGKPEIICAQKWTGEGGPGTEYG